MNPSLYVNNKFAVKPKKSFEVMRFSPGTARKKIPLSIRLAEKGGTGVSPVMMSIVNWIGLIALLSIPFVVIAWVQLRTKRKAK
ncbi:hypothetical protein ACFO25_09360 [Paenactinomyces guangxiensis]|uniref:Uncharacterized protein n=1 Tax=Paenactinomyces guangxiensis TaxID=1490290 RepID=A0A7W1WN38_9BACL|nr:hypothetical protein [Paenactinomyces guangxiensis]MBA4492749.1 hypothetical protein [Paenactinomyces guangxiensis]MBH8590402.1 hypothetical protein [Paenactinomyces guangxiensis]